MHRGGFFRWQTQLGFGPFVNWVGTPRLQCIASSEGHCKKPPFRSDRMIGAPDCHAVCVMYSWQAVCRRDFRSSRFTRSLFVPDTPQTITVGKRPHHISKSGGRDRNLADGSLLLTAAVPGILQVDSADILLHELSCCESLRGHCNIL